MVKPVCFVYAYLSYFEWLVGTSCTPRSEANGPFFVGLSSLVASASAAAAAASGWSPWSSTFFNHLRKNNKKARLGGKKSVNEQLPDGSLIK